ncbi:MAG: hypothetical protein E7677_02765 [Ruminococcaceae bacterium]|nr:hypothetical protein [Oscillospiraceae bacterium]
MLVACDISDISTLTGDNQEQQSQKQTEKQTQKQTEQTMTIGQKNALKKAESYLKYSNFSRQGLIDQLEYEGFEESDIIFAVDNVEVDWNEECYEKAQSYLKYSSFSKQGLIDQLEFEGFTDAQIAYAIKKVGY